MDLNQQMASPMLGGMADPWVRLFSAGQLFASLKDSIYPVVESVLMDVDRSLLEHDPERLQPLTAECLNETGRAVDVLIEVGENWMKARQKEASSTLIPDVQEHMKPVYQAASAMMGKGSVAKQKVSAARFVAVVLGMT